MSKNPIWARICDKVDVHIRHQAYNQIEDLIWRRVWHRVRNQVLHQVLHQVWDTIDSKETKETYESTSETN